MDHNLQANGYTQLPNSTWAPPKPLRKDRDKDTPRRVHHRAFLLQWRRFCHAAIATHQDLAAFEAAAVTLARRSPIPDVIIVDNFLAPKPPDHGGANRPLLVVEDYVVRLLRCRVVDAAAVLRVLWAHCSLNKYAQGGQGEVWGYSYRSDWVMLRHVTKLVAEDIAWGNAPRSILTFILALSKWMGLLSGAYGAFASGGVLLDESERVDVSFLLEGFLTLLVKAVEHPRLGKVLGSPNAVGVRRHFAQSLAGFMPAFQTYTQVVERLDLFRSEVLDDAPSQAVAELFETVGLGNVVIPEIPIPNTRAGMCIHLSAMVGRPLCVWLR